MIDWQPIETAPKDRRIMSYVPGGMWSGGNPYLVVEFSEDEPGYWLTVDDTCQVKPTHWCEMSPPEGAEHAIPTQL